MIWPRIPELGAEKDGVTVILQVSLWEKPDSDFDRTIGYFD
jgi:hypothetical protein